MIVDSSAIVALVQNEQPHVAPVTAALAGALAPTMAAPSVVETLIVLTARHGPLGRTIFERLRAEIGLGVADFTEAHTSVAQRAYLLFGKGRHPAALNFGGCMSYAAAKLAGEPLLAVGNDFRQTDLEFGDGVIGYWPTPTDEP